MGTVQTSDQPVAYFVMLEGMEIVISDSRKSVPTKDRPMK